MKKVLLLKVSGVLVFGISLFSYADLINGKTFYRPFPYFYTENAYFASENPNAKYYAMEQIMDDQVGNHIKNKMGFCLSEYEIYNIEHMGCAETFNTLQYYETRPKGLLRKDILEYYHDMPLEEYESQVKIKKSDTQYIKKYQQRYNNYRNNKIYEDITNEALEEMWQIYNQR